ncbi:zinc-binding dehydrogenase [Actinomyces slackii]|uniref:Erythronolide synthase, modules 3 and 4 n=1 Tax=Actinomyces slackii TaxID=52774 RepID=A0A448KD77_9ACTO|nr:zinc-binding dehydrogenase [Actinomyces slackii]VEG74888.1 Erythronolide synthase, modules 3 and 4 [Actinomyces slackii]
MKAMQIVSFDGAEGMRYQEAPLPEPSAGQVSIDAQYSGVGYIEALLAEGFLQRELPWTPGLEVAGTIREVGPGVTGLEPGQVVAALIMGGGGYGQVVVTGADLVAPLPDGLDPALASVVPANTTTALIALEHVAHMRAGEHVLVHAAAGGLGSQMGQVARLLGAERVVGVTRSPAKRQAVLDLGYDEAWLPEELDSAEGGQFDVVADPVSGPGRLRSLDLLRVGGRLLALGDAARGGDQLINSTSLWLRGAGVIGFNLGALTAADPALVGQYLRRAVGLVASGEVGIHISERAPIQEAPRVIAALRQGSTIGKTVLVHEPRS